jgi:hypothetical protein
MKNMSFSMTTEAVRRREKTVTRRLGWWNLQPGTILQAVEKAQGLKKGEHVKPICLIRVVSVMAEPLWHVHLHGPDETHREGFGSLLPVDFLTMFLRANPAIDDQDFVNRIEFEYLDEVTA